MSPDDDTREVGPDHVAYRISHLNDVWLAGHRDGLQGRPSREDLGSVEQCVAYDLGYWEGWKARERSG